MDIVKPIFSSLLEKTGVFLGQRAISGDGVMGQIEYIQRELERFQSFFRDAHQRRLGEGGHDNHLFKTLVADVMDIAHDAEDAFATFQLSEQRKRKRGAWGRVIYYFKDAVDLAGISAKIEDIKKRIDEISRSMLAYGIHRREEYYSSSLSRRLQEYRRNAPLAEGEDVVGFVRDAEGLVQRLTEGDNRRGVISICGPGGAGKTTLANKIYKSDAVKIHFGAAAAWVCVSQTYSAKELLQEIAKKVMVMSKQESAELSTKDLQEKLSEFLKKRTYLIVHGIN